MKTQVLKSIIVLVISLIAVDSFAQSQCQVYLAAKRPCRHPVMVNQTFVDGEPFANISPNRCRQRAYDYHAWCGFTAQDVVYTSFHVNGTKAGASANLGDPAATIIYQINFAGQWEVVGTTRGR